MEANVVAAVVAGVISLALEIVPGLRDVWQGGVSFRYKPLVVFGLCLAVPLLALAASCAGLDLGTGAVCPADLSQGVLDALLTGVFASAGAFSSYTFVGNKQSQAIEFKKEDEAYLKGAG